jgi:cytoskeleton protein RodZ
MTDAAATTGQLLKAAREGRGLSSQKAADELHLDGWVVEALEAEDYERVGPSVYAKGHLKRYAALLGLSPSDILASYESRARTPKAPAQQPANVRLRTDTPAVSNLPWTPLLGSLAVALLVVGVLWWKPWQQRGTGPVAERRLQETPSTASTGAAADAADMPADARADSSFHSSGTEKAATINSSAATPAMGAAVPGAVVQGSPPPSLAADSAGTGRARLRLSFSADSWVDVHDAEGKRAFAGKGRANSVKTIAGTAPMRVYLGFASGVQLEINNRAVAIGPQFVAGDVARFEAGADGVLRHDSHAAAPPALQTRNAHPTG